MVLINFASIIIGIALFGMCYFILQEEIRAKASAATRHARRSISRIATNMRRPHFTSPASFRRSTTTTSPSTLMRSFAAFRPRRKSAPDTFRVTISKSASNVNEGRRSVRRLLYASGRFRARSQTSLVEKTKWRPNRNSLRVNNVSQIPQIVEHGPLHLDLSPRSEYGDDRFAISLPAKSNH
jgi:hypothetical protein